MLVGISEAAKILGRSTRTLHRWDASGFLKPTCRTRGNQRRYDTEFLENFAKMEHKNRKKFQEVEHDVKVSSQATDVQEYSEEEMSVHDSERIYESQSAKTINFCVSMLYKRAPEDLRKQIFYMLTNS